MLKEKKKKVKANMKVDSSGKQRKRNLEKVATKLRRLCGGERERERKQAG